MLSYYVIMFCMIAVLDNIRSALNVGSIIRTSEGLGIKEIYICGITPDENNVKVLKTSLGAEKNIFFKHFNTTNEAINYLKEKDIMIIALEITEDAWELSEICPKNNFALVVGNEVSGVSPEALKASDIKAKIAMAGKKESLNVSVAYGIAAFTILQNSCSKN